jgi:hypothetical protein
MKNSKPTDHPRSRRKPVDHKQIEPAAPHKPGVDPLAGLPFMHCWRDCVWAADLHPYAKLILLCIGRFMDGKGRDASMSYAQIARDCNIDESTAKKWVRKVRDLWLHVETSKGRLIPKVGRENLYHAMIPPSALDLVLERLIAEQQAAIGVAIGHPATERGGPQPHVLCLAIQEENLSVGGEGSCGRDDSLDADATNVVPLHRPSWGRDLVKGGTL